MNLKFNIRNERIPKCWLYTLTMGGGDTAPGGLQLRMGGEDTTHGMLPGLVSLPNRNGVLPGLMSSPTRNNLNCNPANRLLQPQFYFLPGLVSPPNRNNLNCNPSNRLLQPQFYLAGIFLVLMIISGWSVQGQTLDTYIHEAYKNNPTIRAAEKQHAISLEKISEVNTLPNTEFSGGYMVAGNKMNMMQQSQVSVMQPFPWFGTIPARSNYASALADADLIEVAIAKRNIAMVLSQSYYRLQEISAKQEVLDSMIQLLKVYEQMALTSVGVGKASAVSVIRLQMRQNDLVEQKLILEEDYAGELTAFNKIMNREKVAAVLISHRFALPGEESDFDYSTLDLHPELLKYEELNKVVTLADELNKKESAPNLGLGMEYMQFNGNPDMLMPMVSLSIPLFNKKYKSVSRQNKLRYEELDIQKEAARNSLITKLQTAIRNRNAARIRLETQEKNIKQARNANEILLKNYETGTIDFKDVLDIQELLLEFQMNSVEAIADWYEQTSIIHYYTGQN